MSWLTYVFLAIIFGSTADILQKKALEGEHTLEYLFWRGVFIAVISMFLIPFVNFNLSLTGYIFVVIVGILMGFGIFYRSRALKYMDVSVVQPLMNILPLFVLLVAMVFLGEVPTWFQFSGIMLIVFGTYILEVDHEHQGALAPFKKLFESKKSTMLIMAMLIFAVVKPIDRFMLVNYTDAISYFVLTYWVCALFYIVYHGVQYKWHNLGYVFKEQGLNIFFPALFILLAMISFFKAVSLTLVSLVVAVQRLQSIVTTVEGGIFLHEKQMVQKSIACIIMSFGALLVVL